MVPFYLIRSLALLASHSDPALVETQNAGPSSTPAAKQTTPTKTGVGMVTCVMASLMELQ